MAIQISPAQQEVYRNSAVRRAALLQNQLEARKEKGQIVAKQAADLLKRDFGVSRVRLFGSLLHPELFHSRSDIDLAVWGIQNYYRAVSHLLDIDPEFEFDLIAIEEAGPDILKIIEQEGIDI